ncbi:MAG: hypothetical protein ABGF52_12200 [Candidatus Asgardarchaeum sp.]
MLTGINIHEMRDYVSKLDPDKENPTIFKIGCLDPIIKAEINDDATSFEVSSSNSSDMAKTSLNFNKRNIMAVKFGLKGLENFMDPQTKKPVKFDTISVPKGGKNYNVVSDNIIALLGSKLIKELAEVILSENQLSEEERKN